MSASASERAIAASVALDNLRAASILIVLTFHSLLPYLSSLPERPYRFDEAPYRWQAFPIIDSQRWFGFDLFCAWQYVSLMALMFFLSGLFAGPSLARRGSAAFLQGRLLRIGVPLALSIAVLTPLAYYPAYLTTATDPSFGAFWQQWLALPFWPVGPQWFLFLLLVFTFLVLALHRFLPGFYARMVRAADALARRPLRLFAALAAGAAAVYLPLALFYSPWTWTNVGPIAFETTRPLLYLTFFLAGHAIGALGLGQGLLAYDGPLARGWLAWLAAAVVGFGLWAGTSSLTLGDWNSVPHLVRGAAALSLVGACTAGSLVALALALRFGRVPRRSLASLSSNAYGVYLLHYAPIVWLQFALLDAAIPAIGKAAVVFVVALAVCWPAAAALGNMSIRVRPLAAKRAKSA